MVKSIIFMVRNLQAKVWANYTGVAEAVKLAALRRQITDPVPEMFDCLCAALWLHGQGELPWPESCDVSVALSWPG
jgi:hypothetical protein